MSAAVAAGGALFVSWTVAPLVYMAWRNRPQPIGWSVETRRLTELAQLPAAVTR